jgi:hypothetical protein
METKRLTHDDMKNRFLSGDKIDETTRGNQEDFEIDRQVGDIANNTSLADRMPMENHKI